MKVRGVDGGLLVRDDAVLVIIDVQERLFPAIANKEALLSNALKLVRFAKLLRLPVIASEQIKLGPTVAEIRSELPNLEVISKAEFDALKCAGFARRLDEIGRGALIVVGIEAHICVAQTVLHALPERQVHVIGDAIGSRSVDNWRVGVERMRQAGAVISSTEMVMYELLERAGTDEFRAALGLVKGS